MKNQLDLFSAATRDPMKKPGSYFSVVRYLDGKVEITPHRTMSEAFDQCWAVEEMKVIQGSEVRGPRGGVIAITKGWAGLRWRKRKRKKRPRKASQMPLHRE